MKVDMLISLRTICEILEGLGYGPSNFIRFLGLHAIHREGKA